jgi:protein-S-isoprenylcysteine O-methyltransferase Ste14
VRVALSVFAFACMVAGIAGLYYSRALFGSRPAALAIQIAAALLMIYARVTFGRRSFHAAANPTKGGLVTSGPYAFLRHPIYAAVIYFVWAGALDHAAPRAIAWAALITVGAVVRMLMEERLLLARYPEYAGYRARVKRVVPFVL